MEVKVTGRGMKAQKTRLKTRGGGESGASGQAIGVSINLTFQVDDQG